MRAVEDMHLFSMRRKLIIRVRFEFNRLADEYLRSSYELLVSSSSSSFRQPQRNHDVVDIRPTGENKGAKLNDSAITGSERKPIITKEKE